MKKILSLLLAAVLAVGLLAGCGQEEAPAATKSPAQTQTQEPDRELTILFTGDVHAAYTMAEVHGDDPEDVYNMGYAALAAYVQSLRDAGEDVILVDGGDHLQGTTAGLLSGGAHMVDLMNRVGYDLAVPGEHEFDFGMENFLERTQQADYAYVCCNFTDLTTGEGVFEPYMMVEAAGDHVAFVGIANPQTPFLSDPEAFRNRSGKHIYDFAREDEGQALYSAVQNAINLAKADGADYVIAVGHLGIDPSDAPWTSCDVIANTTGLTAFLDAHSHSVLEGETCPDGNGEEIPLLAVGEQLMAVGQLVLNLDSGNVSVSVVTGLTEEHAKVAEKVTAVTDAVAEKLGETAAQSQVDLVTHDPKDDSKRWSRERETNLGDLAADACRAALGADIALIAGDSIRQTITTGEVTYEALLGAMPFGDGLCLVEVNGQRILNALELSCSRLGEGEFDGFLQVSGICFRVDTSMASPVELDEDEDFVRIDGQRRVSDVTVGGQTIDPEKTYRVVMSDFMALRGGYGYTMFQGCQVLQTYAMEGAQALIRYIQEDLAGVIPAGRYGIPTGEGRIVIQ